MYITDGVWPVYREHIERVYSGGTPPHISMGPVRDTHGASKGSAGRRGVTARVYMYVCVYIFTVCICAVYVLYMCTGCISVVVPDVAAFAAACLPSWRLLCGPAARPGHRLYTVAICVIALYTCVCVCVAAALSVVRELGCRPACCGWLTSRPPLPVLQLIQRYYCRLPPAPVLRREGSHADANMLHNGEHFRLLLAAAKRRQEFLKILVFFLQLLK